MALQLVVPRAEASGGLDEGWASVAWQLAASLDISHYHPKSSNHRPRTQCKMMHEETHLHLLFRVEDQFVRCESRDYQGLVSQDSCVEFFVEPVPGKGYFNFEYNCGGSMLLYYVEDPTPAPDAYFTRFQPVPRELGAKVDISASLPAQVLPEITEPTTWTLRCSIPVEVMTPFVGPIGPLAGQQWRGNFFKCAELSSHPHWASWSPIGERLRFHQPDKFAPIRFE